MGSKRQLSLEQAVDEFEAMFQSVRRDVGFPPDAEIRDWSRAPNGNRYVTMTSRGIKREGQDFRQPMSDTFADAIRRWLANAKRHAATRRARVLMWRTMPEMVEDWRSGRGYVVCARFAVGAEVSE